MKLRRPTDAASARSLHEQAAWWALHESDGALDARAKAARETWLRENPEHRDAYAEATRALDVAAAGAAAVEVRELRRRALAAAPSRWTSGRAAAGLAACVLLVAAGAGIGFGIRASRADRAQDDRALDTGAEPARAGEAGTVYITAKGQRIDVPLPDGSQISLDTDSEVRVRYSPSERALDLVRGQALFRVAKHKPTPFQVYVAGRRVTAMGTVFDVRLDPGLVRVALLKGRVGIAEADPLRGPTEPSGAVVLSPGQGFESQGGVVRISAVDPRQVESWTEGLLDFEDTPLAAAADEFNRYGGRKLVVRGRPETLRISGVFAAADSERFAQTMADMFSLKIQRAANGDIVLSKASS
jgi:transmembrane sensor